MQLKFHKQLEIHHLIQNNQDNWCRLAVEEHFLIRFTRPRKDRRLWDQQDPPQQEQGFHRGRDAQLHLTWTVRGETVQLQEWRLELGLRSLWDVLAQEGFWGTK